ncbi:MAG: SusE domain-containing protein [Thiohalospira sp.]
MNKIKYLLIIIMAALIYSCAEDDFDNPPAPQNFDNAGPVLVDTIDNQNTVLLKQNESMAWDTIAWQPADLYKEQGLITHYAIQIDEQGNNFASLFEIASSKTSDTSIVITVGNLNAKLLENGYSPVETYDLELRVKAFVHPDLETVYSDVQSFTATTYKDIAVPDELYLFGDATAVGWGADTSLAMLKDEGKFIKYAYLENGKKFRFLKAQNTDDNTYNSESLITLSDNVDKADDEDQNFLFSGTTGWYRIEADYLTSNLNITEHTSGAVTYTYDYPDLYLVGDYNNTDGVWDAFNAPAFTREAEGVYTIEKQLKDDAMFKFIGQQDWGDLEWANIKEEGNTGIIGPKDSNGNILFDGGDKTYKITVDLKQGIYTFKEVKTLPQEIWLVGTINGWDSHGQYLAPMGNDIHAGYQYLDDASEIKILVERDSWDGLWGAGENPGEIADGGGNIVVSDLPTYTTPGFYEIKFDLLNKTVVLTQVEFGVIGDAQAGAWDNDVDLTYNQTTKVWEGQVDFLDSGSYKFRANDDWAINIGGSLDNLVHDGDNISTPGAGTYDVVLDVSGPDKFFATVSIAK